MFKINININKLCLSLFCSICITLVHGQEAIVLKPDTAVHEQSKLIEQLESDVNVGFTKSEQRDIVGAVSSVKPTDFMKYDNTQWVRDALEGRISGLRGSDNIRGLSTALIVIDGIPGRNIDLLNMEEVEEITVLKDVSAAAMYGAMGKNGVILVKTKRGGGEKKYNVSVSTGVRTPTRMPNYLNAADYMEYYNEARDNDGLAPTFSQIEVDNTRSGLSPYQYPDVDFYNYDNFNDFSGVTKVVADFSGSIKETKYYINLGYSRTGSFQNVNADVDKAANRFNVRANIDFEVNDWVSSSLDAVAVIARDKNSHTNLYEVGQTFRPHLYAPLIPVDIIDEENHPEMEGILLAANKFDGNILGATQAFKDNTPFADVYAGGYNVELDRISQINNSINFDLSGVIEGLSATTYVSFDFYNKSTTSVTNQYAVYQSTFDSTQDDMVIGLESVGNQDKKDLTESIKTDLFTIRYGFYGLLEYEKQLKEHSLKATLLSFMNSTINKDETQHSKNAHSSLSLNYNYKRRLYADLTTTYMHSIKLAEGNRGMISPTVGLGYVFKDVDANATLNYLKVRASGGLMYSDYELGYFLYEGKYKQEGNFSWYQGAYSNSFTTMEREANEDLEAESRFDLNVGVDALLFNKLWVEANLFQTELGNKIAQRYSQYPDYFKDFMGYTNYGKDRIKGFEFGLNYAEDFEKWSFDIGLNAVYTDTEILERDETYEDEHRNRVGTAVDGIWGLEDMGFFGVDDFDSEGNLNAGIATQFGSVQPGDIRYKSQNSDEIIDDRDETIIGNWVSPWSFGSDITVKHRNFTLFAMLTAQIGGNSILYDSYYRPQGENKYSDIVLGRWTPETAETATFPRLSSQENTNNFGKTSTFWMYDNTNLKISRLQLTYDLPKTLVSKLNMDYASVFVVGSNIFEFSEYKKYRELGLGSNPNFRYYSLGVRLKF